MGRGKRKGNTEEGGGMGEEGNTEGEEGVQEESLKMEFWNVTEVKGKDEGSWERIKE